MTEIWTCLPRLPSKGKCGVKCLRRKCLFQEHNRMAQVDFELETIFITITVL